MNIRAVINTIRSKAREFIGAWVLGVILYMEEQTAVCPGR